MIQVQPKLTAWGLVCGALATAAVTFPLIAETATAQRELASWQARAEAIEDVATEPQAAESTLAVRLASVQTDTSLTAHMRDANVVKPYVTYARTYVDSALAGKSEHVCLAEAIYYEARSETRSGQKAVAEVILNRVGSKHFPDSICGVVYEGSERRTGCQFSFTCDGSMDIAPKGKSWKRSQEVAALVMTGGVTPFTNRATHYHTTAIEPVWAANMRMTKRVGSHVFYRFAPRNYVVSTPSLIVAPPS